MIRYLIAAAVLTIPVVPVAADPQGLCGVEDSSTSAVPCPPYVTYDEDGEEVGAAAHQG